MEYFWTTKQGVKINVDELELSHLRNILKMIIRKAEKEQNKPKFELKGDMANEFIDMYLEDEYSCDMTEIDIY
jgi:hypothetical protein